MDLLDGVTVVENAQAGTGPFAASTLGDLGATVIKVERPGSGDFQRTIGTDLGFTMGGIGASFAALNRNKQFVTANLKSSEGREVYRRLVAEADVVIENMRPGKMDNLGVGYKDLLAINDDLVYCSINGFGRGTPYEGLPAIDFIIQAISGAMSMNGEADGGPVRHRLLLADICGSMYTVQAAICGLFAREFNDAGSQFVEIAMDAAFVSWIGWRAWYSLITGEPYPRGNQHLQSAPVNAYETADSHIMVAGGTRWPAFCRAIGMSELIDDPRFENNASRLENVEALDAIVEDRVQERSTDAWFEAFRDRDVPAAPVYDLMEMWDDPHFAERGLRQRVPTDDGTRDFDLFKHPVRFGGEFPPIERQPAEVGADTDGVLAAAGYSAEERDKLRQHDAI